MNKISRLIFVLAFSLASCSINSDHYFPRYRGCLPITTFQDTRLLSNRMGKISNRSNSFASVKSLLDFIFDRDPCFITIDNFSILVQAFGGRQATLFLHLNAPIPLSRDSLDILFSSQNSKPLPTSIGNMLSKLPFDAVYKIEWYDTKSRGTWVSNWQPHGDRRHENLKASEAHRDR